MKTTIASVIFVSSLFTSQVVAQDVQSTDVLEASLETSIQQNVGSARQQVKDDAKLDLLQFVTDFKFALSPQTVIADIAEVATELLSHPEE